MSHHSLASHVPCVLLLRASQLPIIVTMPEMPSKIVPEEVIWWQNMRSRNHSINVKRFLDFSISQFLNFGFWISFYQIKPKKNEKKQQHSNQKCNDWPSKNKNVAGKCPSNHEIKTLRDFQRYIEYHWPSLLFTSIFTINQKQKK